MSLRTTTKLEKIFRVVNQNRCAEAAPTTYPSPKVMIIADYVHIHASPVRDPDSRNGSPGAQARLPAPTQGRTRTFIPDGVVSTADQGPR